MTQSSFFASIIPVYLRWHYQKQANALFGAWNGFFLFGIEYFSVRALARAFFHPWKYYEAKRLTRGLDLGDMTRVFAEDILLRILGAILRSAILLGALAFEFIVALAGILLFIFWQALPFLIGWGIVASFL